MYNELPTKKGPSRADHALSDSLVTWGRECAWLPEDDRSSTRAPDAWAMNVHGPVVDGTGYVAQQRDYQFANVTLADIVDMLQRCRPLGFSSVSQWDQCQGELADALRACGITDTDVCLQGTAGRFFSNNPQKRFPRTIQDLMHLAQRGSRPCRYCKP